MPRVIFTSHLGGLVPEGEAVFPGGTVGEVLCAAFAAYPGLRHYILDDQERVRKHVVVFLGEVRLDNSGVLGTPVADSGEIYVLQALSGGAL
ncbi:MAG TPA: hypothetical protein VJQ77_03600 [Novosphingobium sp.]|nr:hypothetical protein [Novosphingobium sp.]